jgi:Leucine-rich repeat (LRR) protein
LNLTNTHITDAGLLKLKSFERLYVLNVEGTRVTYEGLAALEKDFPGANFREQFAIARLKTSQQVVSFPKFAGNTTELDVFPQSQIPTVQDIHLDNGDNYIVSSEDIDDLRQLASATAFRVQGRTFPPDGLSFLADLKNLQQVAIFDSNATAVHDDDLKTIAALPKLSTLTLYGNQLTNESFAHLSTAHQIQSISIYGYKLTPELLVHLRGLRGLRRLDLMFWNQANHNTRIEPVSAEMLVAARKNVDNLAGIPNLEELSVMGNLMVDDVVTRFVELKQLKSLKLDGRYCSQETADHIQQALPDCKVERPEYK